MRCWRRRLAVIASVLAAGLLLVSCGDDDDDTAAKTVEAADFREEVNAKCEERDADIAVLFEDFPEDPSDDQLLEFVRGFVPVLREYGQALEDAGVPEGDEDTYREYRELVDEALTRFEAAAEDAAEARKAFEEDDPRFAELERELGLDDCADSSVEADDDADESAGGGNTLAVIEREYSYEFSGEPEAGTVTFAFDNAGEELHMMAVCKVKGEASVADITEAAQADDEAAMGEACEEQSGIDAAGGGQAPGTSYEITITDVDAGRYVAMCFLPDPEGTPHIARGMVGEFEIAEGEVASEPEADVTYVADANGTEGPEELDAGRTTFRVDAEDTSREVVLLKVKDGRTIEQVDTYFKQLDEEGVFDADEAPVDYLFFAFDWEGTRWFTVDLTEGQWGIGVSEPEQEDPPAAEDPHVVLFDVA